MDHRPPERQRPTLHGVVSATATARHLPPRARTAAPGVLLLLALAALALLSGMAGGLLRAGVVVPRPLTGDWLGHAALAHGALMICGFMGTVIGMERAVALKRWFAWLAPLASGTGGITLLSGATTAGAVLLASAAACFTVVNLLVVRRQRAAHTLLLLAGAMAWLAGSLLFLRRPGDPASLPWWFAFLVMTIAAERLEMTRLMRRRAGAQPALALILAALTAGAALTSLSPRMGGTLYGAALLLLALWLGLFDIARRTVHAEGLARYMAVCLLGGYAWLALAGMAWVAAAQGLPGRDAALHALGLGFIVSMMMGHAPVILPAIARIKLQFGRWFYLPLAVLHLSLLVRLGAGMREPTWRGDGALLNVVAIGLFAATVAGAAVRWRTATRPAGAKRTRT